MAIQYPQNTSYSTGSSAGNDNYQKMSANIKKMMANTVKQAAPQAASTGNVPSTTPEAPTTNPNRPSLSGYFSNPNPINPALNNDILSGKINYAPDQYFGAPFAEVPGANPTAASMPLDQYQQQATDPIQLRGKAGANTKVVNLPEWMGGGSYLSDPNKSLVKDARGAKTRDELNLIRSGMPSNLYEIEHHVPLWAGGADVLSNQVLMLKTEHHDKTKVQAVPYTLMINGKMNPKEALAVALTWDNKDANAIPDVNDKGELPLGVAEKIYKQWQETPSVKVSQLVHEIPMAIRTVSAPITKNLPDIVKAPLSGVAGAIPFADLVLPELNDSKGMKPIPGISDKANEQVAAILHGGGRLAGEIAMYVLTDGMVSAALKGVNSLKGASKAAQLAEGMTEAGQIGGAPFLQSGLDLAEKTIIPVPLGMLNGTPVIATGEKMGAEFLAKLTGKNVAEATAASTAAGATAEEVAAAEAKKVAMADISKKLASKLAVQRNMAKIPGALRAGAVMAGLGQTHESWDDSLQQRMNRIAWDASYGAALPFVPHSIKATAGLGVGSFILDRFRGSTPGDAFQNSLVMMGLHGIGGLSKEGTPVVGSDAESKINQASKIIVEDWRKNILGNDFKSTTDEATLNEQNQLINNRLLEKYSNGEINNDQLLAEQNKAHLSGRFLLKEGMPILIKNKADIQDVLSLGQKYRESFGGPIQYPTELNQFAAKMTPEELKTILQNQRYHDNNISIEELHGKAQVAGLTLDNKKNPEGQYYEDLVAKHPDSARSYYNIRDDQGQSRSATPEEAVSYPDQKKVSVNHTGVGLLVPAPEEEGRNLALNKMASMKGNEMKNPQNTAKYYPLVITDHGVQLAGPMYIARDGRIISNNKTWIEDQHGPAHPSDVFTDEEIAKYRLLHPGINKDTIVTKMKLENRPYTLATMKYIPKTGKGTSFAYVNLNKDVWNGGLAKLTDEISNRVHPATEAHAANIKQMIAEGASGAAGKIVAKVTNQPAEAHVEDLTNNGVDSVSDLHKAHVLSQDLTTYKDNLQELANSEMASKGTVAPELQNELDNAKQQINAVHEAVQNSDVVSNHIDTAKGTQPKSTFKALKKKADIAETDLANAEIDPTYKPRDTSSLFKTNGNENAPLELGFAMENEGAGVVSPFPGEFTDEGIADKELKPNVKKINSSLFSSFGNSGKLSGVERWLNDKTKGLDEFSQEYKDLDKQTEYFHKDNLQKVFEGKMSERKNSEKEAVAAFAKEVASKADELGFGEQILTKHIEQAAKKIGRSFIYNVPSDVLMDRGKGLSQEIIQSAPKPKTDSQKYLDEHNSKEGSDFKLLAYQKGLDMSKNVTVDYDYVDKVVGSKGYMPVWLAGNNVKNIISISLPSEEYAKKWNLNDSQGKLDKDKFLGHIFTDILKFPQDDQFIKVNKRSKIFGAPAMPMPVYGASITNHVLSSPTLRDIGYDLSHFNVPKTASKEAAEQMLNKTIYDGNIFIHPDLHKEILLNGGYIKDRDNLKPFLNYDHPELGKVIQKGLLIPMDKKMVTKWEKQIQEKTGNPNFKLTKHDFVTFDDNIKVIGKDWKKEFNKTGYHTFETPSESWKVAYSHPVQSTVAFSLSNLAKMSSNYGIPINDIMAETYRSQIQSYFNFANEISKATGAEEGKRVLQAYPEFGKSNFADGLYGIVQKMVDNGAWKHNINSHLDKMLNKVCQNIVGGRFFKGSTSKLMLDCGAMKDGSYMPQGHIMMSKGQWDKLGRPEHVVGFRYPITDVTAMTKMKVLIGEDHGVRNLGKGNVIASHWDVFVNKTGDYDGDSLAYIPLDRPGGLPKGVGDYLDAEHKITGGDLLSDVVEKPVDKNGNPIIHSKFHVKDTEGNWVAVPGAYRDAQDIMKTTVLGGKGVGEVASNTHIMNFMSINKDKFGNSNSYSFFKPKWGITNRRNNSLLSNLATDAIKDPDSFKRIFDDYEKENGQEVEGLSPILLSKNFNTSALNKVQVSKLQQFISQLQVPHQLTKTALKAGYVKEVKKYMGANEQLAQKVNEYNVLTAPYKHTAVDAVMEQFHGMPVFHNTFRDRILQDQADKVGAAHVISDHSDSYIATPKTKKFIDTFNEYKQAAYDDADTHTNELYRRFDQKKLNDNLYQVQDSLTKLYNRTASSYTPEERKSIAYWLASSRKANLQNAPEWEYKTDSPSYVRRMHTIINAVPDIAKSYYRGSETLQMPEEKK